MSPRYGQYSEITSIWFVRHAPVDLACLYGQMDVTANLTDDKKFSWLSEQLPEQAIWISSDLGRCTQTAGRVASMGRNGSQLSDTYKALREQYFGLWQGLEYHQMQVHSPELYDRFWEDFAYNRPPEGESFSDVVERVKNCLQEIIPYHAGRQVVCYCHSGTIRSALALINGMGPTAAMNFTIDPLSITKIDYFDDANMSVARADFVNRVSD